VLFVQNDVVQEVAAAAAVFGGYAGLQYSAAPALRNRSRGKIPSRSHCRMFGSISR